MNVTITWDGLQLMKRSLSQSNNFRICPSGQKLGRCPIMSSVQKDWQWSERYLPAIRAIVGAYLLQPAPLAVDRHQATDLMVLHNKAHTVAARIRQGQYLDRYGDQFTLRAKRDSGSKTEYSKIAEGWGDLFFYGFTDPRSQSALKAWRLIDLRAFRTHLILSPGSLKTGETSNGDGTYFKWFDLKSFPHDPPILISSNEVQANMRSKSES